MPITIRDVAKAAGVSPMAVSKVLHGRGGNVRVSEIRAAHIRKIAEDLNYTPNQLARSLRGEKKFNIGLIMDAIGPISSGSRYLAHLFDGIHAACFAHGYSLTVCPRLYSEHRKFIADGRFDGVIWAKYQLDADTDTAAEKAGVKVVYLHVPPHMAPDDGRDYLCCDNEQAVYLAVKHLVSLGHTTIDFGVDAVNEDCAEDVDRWEATKKACEALKIQPGRRVLIRYESDDAYEYLQTKDRATAIVLRTENLAVPIYGAAQKLRIRIPEDFSVVGFDSTEFCETVSPSLTAVYQPIEQMARDATEILIKRIENKEVPSRFHVYSCRLDIRSSSAGPKVG
jgi:LacI family transcriptional regulator